MSEASYEKDRQRDAEAKIKAYEQGRYQLLEISAYRYGVIKSNSWCPAVGLEHATFRFVKGLERVKWEVAKEAVRSLNRKETIEEDYS